MRQLEDELGVVLNRTTRRVGLTRSRTCLSCQYQAAVNHIDEGDGTCPPEPRYTRREGRTPDLNLPRTAATLCYNPNLAGFMRDYPDIRLDIDVNDSFVDLINERFDAGIRFGDAVQLDMNVVPLGDVYARRS